MELESKRGEPSLILREPLEKIAGVVGLGVLYQSAKRPNAVTNINNKRYDSGDGLRYLHGLARTLFYVMIDSPEKKPLIVVGKEDLSLLSVGAGHFLADTRKQRAHDFAKIFGMRKRRPPSSTIDNLVPIMQSIENVYMTTL